MNIFFIGISIVFAAIVLAHDIKAGLDNIASAIRTFPFTVTSIRGE